LRGAARIFGEGVYSFYFQLSKHERGEGKAALGPESRGRKNSRICRNCFLEHKGAPSILGESPRRRKLKKREKKAGFTREFFTRGRFLSGGNGLLRTVLYAF